MIGKYFVIFAIVLYVHVVICTIEGVSVDNEKFELLRNDTQICPTGQTFFDSRNAKACKDMRFLVNNETLSEKNEQQFLCFGLYDRAFRLCYMSSMSPLPSNAPLENMDAFDAGVETHFLNATMDVLNFCQNWKHMYPPLAKRTLLYTAQLERVLKELPTCVKMCAKFEGQLESLCAVLAFIDRIFDKPAVEKSEEAGKDGEVKEGVGKVVDPVESRDVVDENVLTKNANGVRTENILEEHTVTGNNSVTGAETKISGSEVYSPASVPTNSTAPLRQKPSEPHTKKSDVGGAVLQTQMENNKKGGDKKGESMGKGGEKSLASLLDGANSKDKPAKNSQIAHPQADGDQRLLGPDISDEVTDKIAPENEPGDDNADFISEHMQNDDQPAGGRVPSEDGEIESPIISASDEDLIEIPAQASVKHAYAPGMRGIRDDDDSHVFGYFTVIAVICIAGYVGYHNKQKILAMMLEGRRSRGGRGRRRPSTANYRKLDCTLEEAVTSQCTSNVTHVIY